MLRVSFCPAAWWKARQAARKVMKYFAVRVAGNPESLAELPLPLPASVRLIPRTPVHATTTAVEPE